MNLTENYKYLKTIQSEKFSLENIKFEVKDETVNILDFKKNLENIHEILSENYYDNELEIFNKLILNTKNINKSIKYIILYYLIDNGFSIAPLYANQFNLETKNIDIRLFLNGIKNGGNNLIFSENYDNFINSYKNPNKLIIKIGKQGYLEQYDYYKSDKPEFKKFNSNQSQNILLNFGKRFRNYNLQEKLDLFGIYDWYLIIDNIFEDFNYSYEKLKKIFTLLEKEKINFKELKDKYLYDEFLNDLYEIKEDIESKNFTILKELSFNNNNINNSELINSNIININKELVNISILKNQGNEFNITFYDISGKINQIQLVNSINLENINEYNNINEFLDCIVELTEEYSENLERNNIDFNIIISKSNGDKDTDDNKSFNNIKYISSNKLVA